MDEKQLIAQKQKGLCHYVGSYCTTEVLNYCVQKKKPIAVTTPSWGAILQEQASRC
ncbi:MAG: conjugal transfer protein TraN [Desulfobacterales bacterium]